MRKVITPSFITPEIEELCQSISECKPIIIPVIAAPKSLINECFYNVDAYIAEHGGQRVLGRSIWQKANVLIEAEAHAVWKSPSGDIIDITPHSNNETEILFLIDPKMAYDGKCIPNIRRSLTNSPLVLEYIALFNERDRLMEETKGGTYSISSTIFNRMFEIEQMFSQRVNRNDPCPCQSGIKYKKCCGVYDTLSG